MTHCVPSCRIQGESTALKMARIPSMPGLLGSFGGRKASPGLSDAPPAVSRSAGLSRVSAPPDLRTGAASFSLIRPLTARTVSFADEQKPSRCRIIALCISIDQTQQQNSIPGCSGNIITRTRRHAQGRDSVSGRRHPRPCSSSPRTAATPPQRLSRRRRRAVLRQMTASLQQLTRRPRPWRRS